MTISPANLRHVRSGDPLRIPAGDWNRIVDATRAFFQQQAGAAAKAPANAATAGTRQASVILVKNASGADQQRFAVLGIDAPIILPGSGGNDDEFQRQVALSCVVPTTAEHQGRFAILLEPLPVGGIGRACVAGVSVVRLKIANEDDPQADVADGDPRKLTTVASGGSAQVLWKEEPPDGATEVWAVVRFGSTGGGSTMTIKLTGASQLTANRWAYSAVEQVPEKQGRYKDKLNGWSGTAYNTVEANNASTGV